MGNWLKLALQLLPTVIQGVVAVEQAMQGASGKAKKQVLMAGIAAAATVAGQAPEEHVAVAGKLADTVVGALNDTGWFGHQDAAAAAVAK